MSFSHNHKRHIYNTFKHLDQILTSAASKLEAAESEGLFPEYIPDATPVQQRVTRLHLQRLRTVMDRFMNDHDIPIEAPAVGAVHAFRTALTFSHIALDELMPGHLAGYGAVDETAAKEIAEFVPELRAVLNQMGQTFVDDKPELRRDQDARSSQS